MVGAAVSRIQAASESLAGTRPGWLLKVFLYWLPVAFAMTVFAGLTYGAVQQNFRQNANDPQIQMAEDAAAMLQAGSKAQEVVGAGKVDLARSLAPFTIVYDDAGNAVASSGQLDGAVPALPSGVLDYVRNAGEDRITWQPRDDVRVAAVITRVGGAAPGFVLAGRSLREVEEREWRLELMAGAAWGVGLVGSLALMAVAVAFGGRLGGEARR